MVQRMKKQILLYLALTLVLTWGAAVALTVAGAPDVVVAAAASGLMLVPALCVILTRLATGEGVRELYLRPNFQDNFLFYLAAWFLPSVVTTFGMLAYFLVFPGNFDYGFTQMSQIMEDRGFDMTVTSIDAVFYSLVVNNIFIAPLINALLALGEELGWRGYLLPKLREFLPHWKAILVTGLLWGVARAPLALLGVNYGVDYPGYPWGGMLAQVVWCLVIGIFLGYLTVRVDSVLPAALASGAITAFQPMGGYLTLDGGNPFVGPVSTGILGGLGWIVTGIVCLVWLIRRPKKKPQEIQLLRTKLR